METIVLYGITGVGVGGWGGHHLEFAFSGEVCAYSTDIVVLLLLM